jgi:uncharacterized protein YegL
MSESLIWLLGPDGKSARVQLPDRVPVYELQYAIGQALDLRGRGFILRKQGGKLIDQHGTLLDAAVRPGDMILVVDTGVQTRQRGLRWMKGRTEIPITEAEDVVPAAYRVLPCYLVVDSSSSMRGEPIATINAELPKLRLKMLRDPELAEVCQLSLVTFGEEASIVVPLTEIERISFPTVVADGRRTDYRWPFTLLRDAISNNLYDLYLQGRRPYRPVVFFLSDGLHNVAGNWHEPLRRLTDRIEFHGAPNIISFGFGKAREDAIMAVGRRAAYMPSSGGPSANLEAFMNFLLSSLTTSMTQSSRDEDDVLVVPQDAPSGWRALTVPR